MRCPMCKAEGQEIFQHFVALCPKLTTLRAALFPEDELKDPQWVVDMILRDNTPAIRGGQDQESKVQQYLLSCYVQRGKALGVFTEKDKYISRGV